MLRILFAITFFPAALLAGAAFGAPPEGADPDSPTGQWFRSLVRDDGMSCCAVSDCRPAGPDDLRFAPPPESSGVTGFEVKLESAWVQVPEYMIVRRDDNPIGKSVICKAHTEVYCVVPYSGL